MAQIHVIRVLVKSPSEYASERQSKLVCSFTANGKNDEFFINSAIYDDVESLKQENVDEFKTFRKFPEYTEEKLNEDLATIMATVLNDDKTITFFDDTYKYFVIRD